MKRLKTKVHYCGGSIPVPSHLQKGTIEIKDGLFFLKAKGKTPKHTVDMSIPLTHIKKATPVEKKYYSSVGYFIKVEYISHNGNKEDIELEIRCFIRRGRTQALMNWWAEALSPAMNHT